MLKLTMLVVAGGLLAGGCKTADKQPAQAEAKPVEKPEPEAVEKAKAKPVEKPATTPEPEPVVDEEAGSTPDRETRFALEQAVSKVSDAAGGGDFAALRAMMVDAFVHDFSFDPGADDAIDAWKRDKSSLTKLVKILDAGCEILADGDATCPIGRRDGDALVVFEEVEGVWRLASYTGE